jgi:hypothetical protein
MASTAAAAASSCRLMGAALCSAVAVSADFGILARAPSTSCRQEATHVATLSRSTGRHGALMMSRMTSLQCSGCWLLYPVEAYAHVNCTARTSERCSADSCVYSAASETARPMLPDASPGGALPCCPSGPTLEHESRTLCTTLTADAGDMGNTDQVLTVVLRQLPT